MSTVEIASIHAIPGNYTTHRAIRIRGRGMARAADEPRRWRETRRLDSGPATARAERADGRFQILQT